MNKDYILKGNVYLKFRHFFEFFKSNLIEIFGQKKNWQFARIFFREHLRSIDKYMN